MLIREICFVNILQVSQFGSCTSLLVRSTCSIIFKLPAENQSFHIHSLVKLNTIEGIT